MLTIVLVSCVAVLLIVGEPPDEDRNDDVPLHPVGSSSYPDSSIKSSRSNANDDENHPNEHQHGDTYHDHHPHIYEHRHNYRKRFTDAIKGVFSDLLNKNSSTLATLSPPNFEEHTPAELNPTTSESDSKVESSENNSSRLKRQLDFGSASSEEQSNNPNNNEVSKTTQPTVQSHTPPSKRPFKRIIKIPGVALPPKTNYVIPPTSSSPPSIPAVVSTTSSEERIPSTESQQDFPPFRKGIRRFRPNAVKPNLQSLSSKEKYDVSQEDSQEIPHNRKNFTLEVVQVERKVVRKEGGHIPALFKKGNYNIEPRLLKVSKQEDANRPQVVYKNKASTPTVSDTPTIKIINAHSKIVHTSHGKSKETPLVEYRKIGGRDTGDTTPVVIKLPHNIPYNDQDVSEEDLRDYHDGHSTFGSKGNFSHTVLSRNVAGFKPNHHSAEFAYTPSHSSGEKFKKSIKERQTHEIPKKARSSNKKNDRKGQGGVIFIEKGKVTERYPTEEKENPFENPNTDIYSVPGGRISSTENYSPKQEVFPFTRNAKVRERTNTNTEENDKTSPAIPASLEELYRQGHPGVLPAPKTTTHQNIHSEPYGDGDSELYSPFRYNPLEDDPPLKFDPESDRFYGEPVPDKDNKDRVAQSNSPVKVENRNGVADDDSRGEDYFTPSPTKKTSEEDAENDNSRESKARNDRGSSRESPSSRNGPRDRFYYGQAYNPSDYQTDYDTDSIGDNDRGNARDAEDPHFEFVGLDDNFGQDIGDRGGNDADNDFFDFPDGIGGVGGGRGGRSRFKPKANSRSRGGADNARRNNSDDNGDGDNEHVNDNGNDDGNDHINDDRSDHRHEDRRHHRHEDRRHHRNEDRRHHRNDDRDHRNEHRDRRNYRGNDHRNDHNNDNTDYDEATTRGEDLQEHPSSRRPPPRRREKNPRDDADYDANNDFGFAPTPRRIADNAEENDHPREVYDTGFINTLKQFDEEIKKLQEAERDKLLKSTALPKDEQTTVSEPHQESPARLTSTSGYKNSSPLIITSPGPIDHSIENAPPSEEETSTPVSRENVGATISRIDPAITEENPFESSEPSAESREDFAESSIPDRSIGAEEEEEDADNDVARRFFDDDFLSTENTGEVIDEIKK